MGDAKMFENIVGSGQNYVNDSNKDLVEDIEDLSSLNCQELLQICILAFFKNFKRIYVGEQINKTHPVYKMLSMVFNITTEKEILAVLLEKLILNLKTNLYNLPVINKTIELLTNISSGYSTARQMSQVPLILDLFKN